MTDRAGVWLRRAHHYAEIAHFEPSNRALDKARNDAPAPDDWDALAGTFFIGRDDFLALYRRGGQIFFASRDLIVELNEEITAERRLVDTERRLIVKRAGSAIADIAYSVPDRLVSTEEDPTPFVDDEDFDYGLHVTRVINDPDRQQRYYAS